MRGKWIAAAGLAAGALCGEVHCHGLRHDSLQGDRAILPLLERFGACVERKEREIIVKPSPLSGLEIDAGDIPDLVPVLAVTAACAEGSTRIANAGRLRLKESDRIAAMQTELAKLGLGVACQGDTLSIQGIGEGYCHAPDRPLWGWNDHRVVMSLAVAATRADGPVAIEGAEAVSKSYPHFFADLQRAGIRVELI